MSKKIILPFEDPLGFIPDRSQRVMIRDGHKDIKSAIEAKSKYKTRPKHQKIQPIDAFIRENNIKVKRMLDVKLDKREADLEEKIYEEQKEQDREDAELEQS